MFEGFSDNEGGEMMFNPIELFKRRTHRFVISGDPPRPIPDPPPQYQYGVDSEGYSWRRDLPLPRPKYPPRNKHPRILSEAEQRDKAALKTARASMAMFAKAYDLILTAAITEYGADGMPECFNEVAKELEGSNDNK
jgi:hypothetical protein